MMRQSAAALVAMLVVGAAWMDVATALGDCDPIAPEYCLYPFPNDFYAEADATTETGLRLRLSPSMMPADDKGVRFDPVHWNTLDGFSPLPSIMTYLGNVSLANVPGHRDLSRSLEADSPTVLIDAETGERVLHFGELDYTTEDTPTRAFLIMPALSLKNSRRYIVAIRYMSLTDGTAVQPSPAFAALRDGTASSDPDVEERRAHFEDIFSRLESFGIKRSELQQAWDFTVASQDNLIHRQLYARDDALSRLPPGGADYKIVSVTDNFNDRIARRILAVMHVPLYMTSPMGGSTLVLDENDNPVFQGFTPIKFTVLIPRTLVDNPRKGAILQYGHGLLGGQGEVEGSYLADIANKYGYILVACDWQGMSAEDYPYIVGMMLRDIGTFNIIPERLTQGILNTVLVMHTMMGDFSEDPVFDFGNGSVVDTEQRYYFGNSQGGIFGHNYLAVSPWVDRGCLGVPGTPYNLLLARSVDFTPFFTIIKSRYPSSFDQIFLLGLMGMLWDRSEPAGYLNTLGGTPLPGTNRKELLIQYALGDAQVSWLGAYVSMRSTNAAFFEGNVVEQDETLVGFDFVSGSVSGRSVGVGFQYQGVPPAPVENTPPLKEFDTHGYPRKDTRANQQMHEFFTLGVITDYCYSQGCRDW